MVLTSRFLSRLTALSVHLTHTRTFSILSLYSNTPHNMVTPNSTRASPTTSLPPLCLALLQYEMDTLFTRPGYRKCEDSLRVTKRNAQTNHRSYLGQLLVRHSSCEHHTKLNTMSNESKDGRYYRKSVPSENRCTN